MMPRKLTPVHLFFLAIFVPIAVQIAHGAGGSDNNAESDSPMSKPHIVGKTEEKAAEQSGKSESANSSGQSFPTANAGHDGTLNRAMRKNQNGDLGKINIFEEAGEPQENAAPAHLPHAKHITPGEIIGTESELTIRMAAPHDAGPDLRGLYESLGQHLAEKTNDENVGKILLTNRQIAKHFEQKLMECLLVTQKLGDGGEKFVGYALFYFAASSTENKIMHLEDFFIEEKFRGSVLANRVFVELAKKADEHKVASIEWTVPAKNVRAVNFYNKQPEVEELTKNGRELYWRLDGGQFGVVLEKAEKIKNFHATSMGNSCGPHKNGLKKIDKMAALHLAQQWVSLLKKTPKKNGNGKEVEGIENEKANAGHPLNAHELAALLAADGQTEKALGAVTASKLGAEGEIVGMALFHCSAYSTWTGPYVWMDNLVVVVHEHLLEQAGTLIMGQLVKLAEGLGAKRIEWMAPKETDAKGSEGHCRHNNELFEKLGSINMSKEANGQWLLYRWPEKGYKMKIEAHMKKSADGATQPHEKNNAEKKKTKRS